MRCPSGKTSYLSRELGIEALIQNHIRFNHREGAGPLNVYECLDCGDFHFTSRPPQAAELSEPITINKIRQEKNAGQWERKFRF